MKSTSVKRKEKFTNFLYVVPMILLFCVFILYPIIQVFSQSFFTEKLNGDLIFSGLSNYKRIFSDPETPKMLLNTCIWVFVGTAAKIVLGLLMAVLLYKKFPGKRLLTVLVLIPYAMPAAVSCITWRLMYNPIFGHLMNFLKDLGILKASVDFLGSPKTSLLAVMIVNVWAVAPFCCLNILSSMYQIPESIYEAARVDGANQWHQFWHITIPSIASSVKTLALLIAIWGYNAFDVIYMMTNGGPANSSSILVNFIYLHAFQFSDKSYSQALSVISFLILSVFAVAYVRSKKQEVSYE